MLTLIIYDFCNRIWSDIIVVVLFRHPRIDKIANDCAIECQGQHNNNVKPPIPNNTIRFVRSRFTMELFWNCHAVSLREVSIHNIGILNCCDSAEHIAMITFDLKWRSKSNRITIEQYDSSSWLNQCNIYGKKTINLCQLLDKSLSCIKLFLFTAEFNLQHTGKKTENRDMIQ